MSMTDQWFITDGQSEFFIEYSGTTPGGQAKITINGNADTYYLSLVNNTGYFVTLPCGSKECLLKVSLDGDLVELLVDGVVQDRLPPAVSDNPVVDADNAWSPQFALQQKRVKSGMSSFLSLIILSLVNIVLILFQAPISFPFSIFTSVAAVEIGSYIAEKAGNPLITAGGIITAVLIIGAYALFYFLAAKRTWPIWIAFGLILFDTLLLLLYAVISEAFVTFIIDLAFHIWIIWSLARLGLAKKKLRDLTRLQVEADAADGLSVPPA